jgi:methylaspartate mutase sigma subunit
VEEEQLTDAHATGGGSAEGTLVIGVIGQDVHIIGLRLLELALVEAGFRVTNLGVMVPQQEFINAAIETNADAIVVSSLYGHGELDCRGLREQCDEAGLTGVTLLVGGNLVIGKKDWPEVERTFREMGYDGVFPPGMTPDQAVEAVRNAVAADRRDPARAERTTRVESGGR